MAHWIITDHGHEGRTYMCSNCGNFWNSLNHNCDTWNICPWCHEKIEEDKEEKSYVKELAELGKYVAEGFAAGLESGGFVMISRKEYDELRGELDDLYRKYDDTCCARDNAIDILKEIGINSENVKKVVPGSGRFMHQEVNSATLDRRIFISFQVRDEV